jgi:hypothetical protein
VISQAGQRPIDRSEIEPPEAKPPGESPTPPPPPPEEVLVQGGERLAWDQPAESVEAMRQLSFLVYIDSTRVEAPGVECAEEPGEAGFACEMPLPPLEIGPHTLQVAAYLGGEMPVEGPLSSSISVRMVSSGAARILTGGRTAPPTVASGLDVSGWPTDVVDPSGLAVLPDGSLLLAERSGRVHLLRDGTRVDRPMSSSTGLHRRRPLAGCSGCRPRVRQTRAVFLSTRRRRVAELHGTSCRATRWGRQRSFWKPARGRTAATCRDAHGAGWELHRPRWDLEGDDRHAIGPGGACHPDGTTPDDQPPGRRR